LGHIEGYMEQPEAPVTRVWQKIGLIAEISSACRRLRPDEPAFVEVLRLIQAIVPFDAATLYTRDASSGRYLSRAVLEQEVKAPDMLLRIDPADPANWQPRTRQPLVWSVGDEARSGPSEEPFAAIMVIPLEVDGAVIGLLNLGSASPGILTQRQLKLMSVVADQLAVCLERLEHVARIETQHRELQQAHARLRESQAHMIAQEKLAAVSEIAATINHQINNPLSVIVGNIDCLMLEESGLSAKSQERLRRMVGAALRIGEVNRHLLNIRSIAADTDSKTILEGVGVDPAAGTR
jgi:signal transduction histidine kinase